MSLINLADFESEALRRLPRPAADYFRSGARDERTVAHNREAFSRWRLRQRVLVDVSNRSTATTVLGHPVDLPVLVAPTAFHGLAHADAEVATAAGASAAGTVLTLSSLSNQPVEAVVAATDRPVFFQLYVYKDRGATRDLVARAVAAGCAAVVLTADAAVIGTRERDVRNRFTLPSHLRMANARADLQSLGSAEDDSALTAWVRDNLDASLSWADLDWLVDIAGVPVVLKGVARADDARRAVDHGVAAVQVSNHGGRQLDGAVATLDALPEVVEAVDGACEVWLDGGVRRGTDVLMALALGAQVVGVGRPALWGLAVDGADGVAQVLRLLQAELDEAMALCGAPTVREITQDLLARPG
ncbi:MAG: 4-hydroxymandelate oxidase [Myxococcota bacterium]|jgi:4-hydroxymandelate oxidase